MLKDRNRVYEIMKDYPILNVLFNECPQRVVTTNKTKFGDNFCQIVREYPIIGDLESGARSFLDKLQKVFLKNRLYAYLDPKGKTDFSDTLTKRIPSKDLDFLRENCILVSCGNDAKGQRKLRVMEDVNGWYEILSDVGVCTKDEWDEFGDDTVSFKSRGIMKDIAELENVRDDIIESCDKAIALNNSW